MLQKAMEQTPTLMPLRVTMVVATMTINVLTMPLLLMQF